MVELSAVSASESTQTVVTVINDFSIHTYLDCGADVTLIRSDTLAHVTRNSPVRLKPSKIKLKTITGGPVKLLGSVKLCFYLGSTKVSHTFHVTKPIPRMKPMLLGLDFLNAHDIGLHFQRGCITFNGENIPLLQKDQLSPKSCEVRAIASITIEANTEIIFSAKLHINSLDNSREKFSEYDSVLEPNDDVCFPLSISHGLVRSNEDEIPVKMTNFGDTDLELNEGDLLGQVHTCSFNDADEFQIHDKGPEVEINNLSRSEDDSRTFRGELDSAEERSKTIPPVDLSNSPLTAEQRQRVEALLLEFSDVFSTEDNPFGHTDLLVHTIDIDENVQPVQHRAYRANPKLREEIQKQLHKLLSHDVIEPSNSAWSSPLIMVKKKQIGNKPPSYRAVSDLRSVNKLILPDKQPVPLIDETIEAMRGNKWFSTLDLTSGYHQIPLHPDSKKFTAFSDGQNLWQFKRMPMGLSNSGQSFQRLMHIVFSDMKWEKLVTYLDDICVMGSDFDIKLANLRETFARLRTANLKLSPEKCDLFKSEITFLGFKVSGDGIKPCTRNVDKVKNWPTPTNVSQVRGFCGLASYYRRFIHNFSIIAAPLYELTQKDASFVWSDKCNQAFQTLKNALTSAPIVAHPDFKLPWLLYTDASNDCIGSVLAQVHDDGKEHVVAYFSAKLSKVERKWATFDKEFYAIVASVRKFRHYLRDSKFTIITDHRPLLALRKLNIESDLTGKRARWVLELDPLNWSIQHKAGSKHSNADSLSRYPHELYTTTESRDSEYQEINTLESTVMDKVNDRSMDTEQIDETHERAQGYSDTSSPCSDPDRVNTLLGVHRKRLKIHQENDQNIQQIIQWLSSNKKYRPGLSRRNDEYRSGLWRQIHSLVVGDDGLLYKQTTSLNDSGSKLRAVIPESLITTVLYHLHGAPLTGHTSAHHAITSARKVCYWPHMTEDITDFCSTCETCQQQSMPVPSYKAPLLPVQPQRRRHIAIDITEMPLSTTGHKYLLTVTDLFTKYLEMYPMKDQTVLSVTRALFDHYVSDHSLPLSIHSDRGAQFEARVFQSLLQHLGIIKTRTTAYRPSANGSIERKHRDIKHNVAKILRDRGLNPNQWDTIIGQVKLCHNAAIHSTTGFSPFFLERGEEPMLPVHVLFGPKDVFDDRPMPPDHYSYATALQEKLQMAYEAVRDNISASKKNQAFYHDRSVRFQPYDIDEMVMIKNERRMSKLDSRYLGPYRIIGRSDDGRLYRIIDVTKTASQPSTVHYNKLKPFQISLATKPMYTNPPAQAAPSANDHMHRQGCETEISPPTVTITAASVPQMGNPPNDDDFELSSSVYGGEQPTDGSAGSVSVHGSLVRTQSPPSSSNSHFSPPDSSTPNSSAHGRSLTPSRTGRRRFRPLRLSDFIVYDDNHSD